MTTSADRSWLRDGTPDDAPALAAIYGEAIASGISTMEVGPCTADEMRARVEGLGAREAVLVVDEQHGISGFGWLKAYSPRLGYRHACETSIYLTRRAWGTGCSDRLQEALFERARGLDYRHVVAKIITANERSLRFHARHGFELVGVQHKIGLLGGAWHDVSILERILDQP